jgi:hypothetical protein
MSAHIERLHFAHPLVSVHRTGVAELLRRACLWARQALCGLRGHSMLLHFEPDRLSLRCFACGAETTGWTLDIRPEFRRDARAHLGVLRRAA